MAPCPVGLRGGSSPVSPTISILGGRTPQASTLKSGTRERERSQPASRDARLPVAARPTPAPRRPPLSSCSITAVASRSPDACSSTMTTSAPAPFSMPMLASKAVRTVMCRSGFKPPRDHAGAGGAGRVRHREHERARIGEPRRQQHGLARDVAEHGRAVLPAQPLHRLAVELDDPVLDVGLPRGPGRGAAPPARSRR